MIFDIGANRGDNIPYYALKARTIVAFEANPVMCEVISDRYAELITSGRLFVENAVLCAAQDCDVDTVDFYVHRVHSVLSQFPVPSEDELMNFEKVKAPVMSLGSAVEKYGTPTYAKIDVEHYDAVLIQELFRLDIFPDFISAECHSESVVSLLLQCREYTGFKLVDGNSVQDSYRDYAVRNRDGTLVSHSFPHHSAGPFGEDIQGSWIGRSSMRRRISSVGLGWRDLHASREHLRPTAAVQDFFDRIFYPVQTL